MDNVNNEVSLQFTNVVEGTKELNDYEARLNRIKNIIQTFPKNFTLGGHDYTAQINKTNTLLLHLNKNLLNTKNLFNGTFGVERNMENQFNLARFEKVLKEVKGETKNTTKEFDLLGRRIGIAFNYTTLKNFLRGLKNITKTMSGLVKKASDYGEDINLFQVAFDYTYQDAEKFVNKMTEMYGLDEDWLTRTTGIFKQLSNAMSLSTEEGTKLSELMTQMSLDISSLYNLDVSKGSSVLQSALAGQTRPIRGATGADITQATLQQTLNELGIDQSITNLSYAEKRLVIIISLTRQLQASVGDMAKTIEQPANQTRILNEQWERLQRSVGNVFLPLIKRVLPYLNAILMVLTEIINVVASLFGYNIKDFNAVAGVTDSVLELEDGLESANQSAEKLKRGLRSFDKLNNITTPTASTGNVGVGAGGGINPAIWQEFNKAYDKYFKQLKDVEMEATRIRDRIMEWLGFTKHINEETEDVYFTFDKITFGTIATGSVLLLGMLGTISKIWRFVTKIGNLLGISGSGATAGAGAGSGIIGGLGYTLVILGSILTFLKNIDTEFKKMDTYDYKPSGLEQFLLYGETEITRKVAKILNIFRPLLNQQTVFDASISPETEKKVKSFYENIMSLNKQLVDFDLGNKIISDKDVENIKTKLKKITKAIYDELDSDRNETLKKIDLTKSMLSEENYNSIINKVNDFYNKRINKTQEAENRINEIIETARNEGRQLEQKDFEEITNLRNTILDTGLESMSESEEEFEKLRIRIGENIKITSLQQAGEYLKIAKDTKEKAIKEAEEQYESIVLEAEKLKRAGAISDEEYNAIVESARLTKEKTIKEAEEQYDGIVKTTKEKLGENARYIDENTGKIKSKWTLFWEDVKKEFDIGWENIKKWWNEKVAPKFTKEYWEQKGKDIITSFLIGIENTPLAQKLEKYFDFSTLKIKTPHLSWKEGGTQATGTIKTILEALSLPTSLPKLKVDWYANGGLPEVGQLFVANERGAELVGNIGGQSFVANQNQVVDLLDRKLANVNGGIQNATFIVQVGDEKIGEVTLNNLQQMAKSNGKPITIGV